MTQSDVPSRPGPTMITSDDLIALNNHGLALQAQRQFAEALSAFDRILALAPNVAEAHYNRGNVLGALGRLDEAIAAYDLAIAFKPDFFSAFNNRGLVVGEAQALPGSYAEL